jgi:tetratricopeptide (TPR) repeat protein
MGQNSTRAYYALLYTQAQDKNYIDEVNDSLISVAVDYYRNTDDTRHKFLSYYYKGRVLANAENYLDATTCYMEAEQLTDAVGDDYLVGLLYAELGRIYRLYYDYPKSLEAHQKAAECYERAGKIRHRNYMWYNQSGVYRNINRCDESERLLRMTLASAQDEEDNVLVELCMGDLVMLFIEEERMSEAWNLYEEFKPLKNDDFASAPFMGS